MFICSCWGWGVKLTWGDMTKGGAVAGPGAGIMGWCCAGFHQGTCILMPLSHCPCRLLLRMYLMSPCITRVMITPRKRPSSRLEPSISAFQFRFNKPVLLVASLFFIMSPKTELSHAPWMSRGHMRGTAEFWGQVPVICRFPILHIVVIEYLEEMIVDCAEYGRDEDEEEAGAAGLPPVGLVPSGVVVSGEALVPGQQQVKVVAAG